MEREPALFHHFLKICQHPLSDACNGEHLLRFGDQIGNLLRKGLDGFRRITVGANAERIAAVDFKQISGLEKNAGNGLIVHGKRLAKPRPVEAKEPKVIAIK